MTNVFELFGKIVVDASGAEQGMNKVSRDADSLATNLGNKFKKIASIAATVFAVDKIKDFGQTCVQTYADIAAAESAFEQTMSEYADSARQKMGAIADETGVVSDRLMPYMTKMTAKFQGLGYDIDEATTLATEGLRMASDAAAFWDVSLDDAMSHLNSFINGSYEGGEAIGLFANDTQMAAYAVEQGLIAETKAWAQLDEATKQAIRMQNAKEQLSNSGITGQASEEADSFANVTANLTAMWQRLLATIGKPILQKMVLPIIQKLTKIVPNLSKGVEGLMDSFGEWLDKVGANFEGVFGEDGSIDFEALGEAIANMFSDLGASVPSLLANLGNAISSAWKNAVWPMIQGLFSAAFGVELPEWSVVADTIKNWWDTYIMPVIGGIGNVIMSIITPVSDDDGTPWTVRVSEWLSGIIGSAIDLAGIVLKMIFPQTDEDGVPWVDKISAWLKDAWNRALALLGEVFSIGELLFSEDDDGTTTAQKITDWFNRVLEALGDALLLPIDLLFPDFAQTIRDWLSGKTKMEAQKAYREQMEEIAQQEFTPVAEANAGKYAHWTDAQKDAAMDYLYGADIQDNAWMTDAVAAMRAAGLDQESIEQYRTDVSDALAEGDYYITIEDTWFADDTAAKLQAELDKMGLSVSVDFVPGYGAMPSVNIPGFAKGLDYVPYDEFPAFLHKGEAVLTASEAAVWRNGGGIGNTSNLEAKLDSLLGVMQQVVSNTGRGQNIVLDSGVLVGQTAAQMDMQLGTMASRKGRRNG